MAPAIHWRHWRNRYAGIRAEVGNELRQHGLLHRPDLGQDVYRAEPDKITHNRTALTRALKAMSEVEGEPLKLSLPLLDEIAERLSTHIDRENGGIGGAPKFPHPTTIDRLLRHWRDTANSPEPDLDALYMATLTLTRMADGGLFDHVGGGFCRYSVDRYWQIPHFEKMLYDNGPLLALYAQAFLATGDSDFGRTAAAMASRSQPPVRTCGTSTRRCRSPGT